MQDSQQELGILYMKGLATSPKLTLPGHLALSQHSIIAQLRPATYYKDFPFLLERKRGVGRVRDGAVEGLSGNFESSFSL